MEKIKLFIVDDHNLFVQGLSSLFSEIEDFEVEGVAYSGQQLLEILHTLNADVYIVDIHLPDITGDKLVTKIKETKKKAGVLVLTMYNDYAHLQNLVKCGTDGYMLKAADMNELVNAIRTIASGGKFFDKLISQVLFENIAGDLSKNDPFDNLSADCVLTRREAEVLSFVLADYSSSQIADKLFISQRTVETHRKHILAKTGTKTTFGLLEFARKNGIRKFGS